MTLPCKSIFSRFIYIKQYRVVFLRSMFFGKFIFPLSIHHLTIDHRHHRAHCCSRNPCPHNSGRIHAPILAPVCDHIHRDQLKRRNINNQKRTHLITGDSAFPHRSGQPPASSVFFQLPQFLHRP